jgi:hypothetical protein
LKENLSISLLICILLWNGKELEGGGRQNPLYDTKKAITGMNTLNQNRSFTLIWQIPKAEELKAGFEL